VTVGTREPGPSATARVLLPKICTSTNCSHCGASLSVCTPGWILTTMVTYTYTYIHIHIYINKYVCHISVGSDLRSQFLDFAHCTNGTRASIDKIAYQTEFNEYLAPNSTFVEHCGLTFDLPGWQKAGQVRGCSLSLSKQRNRFSSIQIHITDYCRLPCRLLHLGPGPLLVVCPLDLDLLPPPPRTAAPLWGQCRLSAQLLPARRPSSGCNADTTARLYWLPQLGGGGRKIGLVKRGGRGLPCAGLRSCVPPICNGPSAALLDLCRSGSIFTAEKGLSYNCLQKALGVGGWGLNRESGSEFTELVAGQWTGEVLVTALALQSCSSNAPVGPSLIRSSTSTAEHH
jgi:hypothetical protein